ncbi:MAG: DUF1616 domain-containing protein [Nitrososphaerota archaeon]|jgi:uncharacterized membrane protein|nr:DUF1616 domain-containing protein [Nitrososphaerota archaeon]
MKLSECKIIFVSICLIGVLLIASPVLIEAMHLPGGEVFSELFLLGPENMAQDIPFNVVSGHKYLVNLGVGNHMDAATFYVCAVKLRNQTEPFPNSTSQTASSLPTLYTHYFVVKNGENSIAPLIFSISADSPTNDVTVLRSITINDVECNVDKFAQYDPDNDGYYYQLFVELWAYNPSTEITQYQNRWVYFWFNVTS